MKTFTKFLSKLTLSAALAGALLSTASTAFASNFKEPMEDPFADSFDLKEYQRLERLIENYIEYEGGLNNVQETIWFEPYLTDTQKRILILEAEIDEDLADVRQDATRLINKSHKLNRRQKTRLLRYIETADYNEIVDFTNDFTSNNYKHYLRIPSK